MSEWKECKLDDIAQLKKDSWQVGDEVSSYIGLEHIEENKLRLNDIGSSEEVGSNKYRFKAGDTLFGKLRPYFRKVVKPDFDGICSTDIWVVQPKDGVDADFLFYFFANEELVNLSYASSSGTRMPRADWDFLKETKWPLPSPHEQKAIASVLSSLDDKIDLLHRQNQTLEAMAETLFRQWFQPSQKLRSAGVEEAEEDWEEVKVGDFVETNRSNINKDYDYELIEYLNTGSLTEGKITEIQQLSLSEAPSRAKRLVKHNDIIISTVRPNQKHYGIIKNPNENMVVSTGFCVISCHNIDPHFIYFLLTNDEMTEYLHSIAEGSTSTYPSLKPSDIERIEFQMPPKESLKRFSEIASEYWDKIEFNSQQIQILEKLRDTLLPKLMSGEVRVAFKEREKQALPVQSVGKRKRNIQFEEAILISAIVKAFYTPKIGNVSRQWYQKISYLHKRKLKDNQAKLFELTEEYGKKAFKPADQIEDIDKYFYERDYWNWKVFENWTVPTLKFIPVKKLGVWATVDYCLIELKENGEDPTTENVLDYLSKSKEWKHKLKQPEFTPKNIELAIEELFEMYNY